MIFRRKQTPLSVDEKKMPTKAYDICRDPALVSFCHRFAMQLWKMKMKSRTKGKRKKKEKKSVSNTLLYDVYVVEKVLPKRKPPPWTGA